jgi:hypothetical protein
VWLEHKLLWNLSSLNIKMLATFFQHRCRGGGTADVAVSRPLPIAARAPSEHNVLWVGHGTSSFYLLVHRLAGIPAAQTLGKYLYGPYRTIARPLGKSASFFCQFGATSSVMTASLSLSYPSSVFLLTRGETVFSTSLVIRPRYLKSGSVSIVSAPILNFTHR